MKKIFFLIVAISIAIGISKLQANKEQASSYLDGLNVEVMNNLETINAKIDALITKAGEIEANYSDMKFRQLVSGTKNLLGLTVSDPVLTK